MDKAAEEAMKNSSRALTKLAAATEDLDHAKSQVKMCKDRIKALEGACTLKFS